MFKNGLQCRDEKKFCKASGQIFIDNTHNRTTYEWNTEILTDKVKIPANYFCIWDIHPNDVPISVSIKQVHDVLLGGDKQLLFGTANNTEKWVNPNDMAEV